MFLMIMIGDGMKMEIGNQARDILPQRMIM